MNHYSWEEIEVGTAAEFQFTVTAHKMELFHELTGDDSTLHVDEAFAQARGHKGRVVYGMLGASLFSTLAGVYLPGETCLLHGVDTKFIKPIYIGDTLTVRGRVTEKNDTFRVLTIKADIQNQAGVKVTRGVIRAGVEQPLSAL